MSPLLTIILIGIIAGLFARLLRPAPRTHVIYVPVEVAEERAGNFGCLPLIFVAALALLIIVLAR